MKALYPARMAALAAWVALAPPPAMAASGPATRLVSCGADSCVMVSGQRAGTASQVRINGHDVAVEGARTWHARLPLDTIRQWSRPMARSIDVTVLDPGTGEGTTRRAALPIGLLGHVTDLASLVVGTR